MRRAFLHGRSDRRHGSRDRFHFRHFTADLLVRSFQLSQIIVMRRLHRFTDPDNGEMCIRDRRYRDLQGCFFVYSQNIFYS